MNIQELIQDTKKGFGPKSIRYGTEVQDFKVISSGVFGLDYLTFGGIVEGKTNLFLGKPSSGKTSQSLRLIAEMQKKYEGTDLDYAAFVDLEDSYEATWSARLGADPSKILLPSCKSGEDYVDWIISSLECDNNRLVVVDSVAALVSKKVIDRSASDETMGVTAKLMSNFLKVANIIQAHRYLEGNPVTLLLINSHRDSMTNYGDPRVVTGGKQQGFQSRLTVEYASIPNKDKKEEDAAIGASKHSFKISKFKNFKSVLAGEFNVVQDPKAILPIGTVDDFRTVIIYAKKHGFVTGAGQHQKVDGIGMVFKNMDEIRSYLIESPLDYMDLKAKIIADRRVQYGLPALPPDNYLIRHYGEGLPNETRDETLQTCAENIDEDENVIEDTEE